jgi:hypothetical protein
MSEQRYENATIAHDDGSTEDVVLVHDAPRKPAVTVGEYQDARRYMDQLETLGVDLPVLIQSFPALEDAIINIMGPLNQLVHELHGATSLDAIVLRADDRPYYRTQS